MVRGEKGREKRVQDYREGESKEEQNGAKCSASYYTIKHNYTVSARKREKEENTECPNRSY